MRSSIRSSQAELHERFGGVVPEVASRRHLELVGPVIETALADAAATLDDITLVAATQGPGLIGALLVGLAAGKAIAWAPRAAVRAGRPPARARRGARAGADAGRASLPVPARLGRAHALPRCAGARRARAARGHARRRCRRGLRQGGAPARPRLPGRPALEQLALEGDPGREPFPRALAGRPGCDVSFSGLKSALARRVTELGDGADAAGPTSRPATRRRSSPRSSSALRTRSTRRAGDALAVAGGVASNASLRGALAQLCRARGRAAAARAARPVRRQRRHDRGRRRSTSDPLEAPSYLALDAYARSPVLRPLHSRR